MKDGWSCTVVGNDVVVKGPLADQKLEVSFQRTIRVPDSDSKYDLPPTMGEFSLFKVSDYGYKLPSDMAKKGGVMMPMYRNLFSQRLNDETLMLTML